MGKEKKTSTNRLRIKVLFFIGFLCICPLIFTACENASSSVSEISYTSDAGDESNLQEDRVSSVQDEENLMIPITVQINGETFDANLYANETTQALLRKFPMTLQMQELNGNEKYVYLDTTFPTDNEIPETIHAGDIMLYGSNCLVLFYQDCSSNYSYTPIGKMDYPEQIAQVAGSNSITATFSITE